ncbi:conserved hypothetical protein [Trichinella spiralis]|uniref:hypothetical protein n=1 Tax=Trichinella spiralis TaxID=6334 RepID=UPI0001EFC939|nr:conserved hypothetical protein [Trichinella spiralis]
MDYDFSVRFTRSGRVIQKPIVLHDADISDPETVSSAELMSEDKELEPFSKTEYTWIKKAVRHFRLIVERSHIYVTLCSSNFQTNKSELETFPEVLLKMGLVLMPQYSIPSVSSLIHNVLCPIAIDGSVIVSYACMGNARFARLDLAHTL